MKSDLVAALDIGTSKVACIVARLDESSEINIIGVGYHLAQGIRNGVIVDIREAAGSILSALHAAEKMSNETIDSVLVNISGKPVQSHYVNIESTISGHEVTEKDMQLILRNGYQQFQGKPLTLIHCIPQNYTIDDVTGIKDPRGMFGVKLSTDLHIISASDSIVMNLNKCMASCHVDVQGYVASAYMSGLACLSEDEKQLGVILMDIGAGGTSISVWTEGNLIYTDQVNIGGQHVTNDIAKMLSCSISFAERIKSLYGAVASSMHDHYDMIDIDRSDDDVDEEMDELAGVRDDRISKSALTRIIKPRMEELFDIVRSNINASGLADKTGSRMVLTGGGSQIAGLKELAAGYFPRHLRLGKPNLSRDAADIVRTPGFCTIVGMLKYAAENDRQLKIMSVKNLHDQNSGVMKRAVGWFRRNF
jgi:cell division protein FtsA